MRFERLFFRKHSSIRFRRNKYWYSFPLQFENFQSALTRYAGVADKNDRKDLFFLGLLVVTGTVLPMDQPKVRGRAHASSRAQSRHFSVRNLVTVLTSYSAHDLFNEDDTSSFTVKSGFFHIAQIQVTYILESWRRIKRNIIISTVTSCLFHVYVRSYSILFTVVYVKN